MSDDLKVTGLLCEYAKNPVGVDTPTPRFSWELVSDRKELKQRAYRVMVSSSLDDISRGVADKWDTGVVESSQSVHLEYAGESLSSGVRYFWKVGCWDDKGNKNTTFETAWFEMGLLNFGDWQGKWIGADESISAPMFRKDFNTKGEIDYVRAYICGLGYYELYINGQKIGQNVLSPNWTNYDKQEMKDLAYPYDDKSRKRVLYVTHNVTRFINNGENTIGVILGNGWYNQRERLAEGKLWYDTPRLIAQINIQYMDGSSESVFTDSSWKSSSSQIIFNNIFYGEVLDARLEKEGWNTTGYDDSDWENAQIVKAPEGKLSSQTSPPDKIISEIKPVSMNQPEPDVFVYDMGQNISGWVRLKVMGNTGDKVLMRFAEELDPKGMLEFNSAGGERQIQSDIYCLRGDEDFEYYEPRFTWHTFRYVEITGFPGEPDMETILGKVIHSDVEESGSFQCSDDLLNKIQHIYRWAHLNNMHSSIPSDCPHRERLGYTGDGQLTAETSMYNFWMPGFYTKWITDMADAQNSKSGFVPHTAPFYGGGGGHAWGAAFVIVPWAMYQFYGDKRILEIHYNGMKRWLEYMGKCTENKHIIVREEPGSWCLGDWCVPKMEDDDKAEVPKPLVNTFVYAVVARLMGHIANVMDNKSDSERFNRLADDIGKTFHNHFFDKEAGYYSIGRHGTDALGLALNPPEKIRKKVLENLLYTIKTVNDGHLDTGIVGTPVLLDILTEYGYEDVVLDMLKKETYPGYGYMIANGATTMWETWSGSGSHCHHMFGTVSGWFFKTLAGIQPGVPGFEKIIIRPVMLNGINWVKAHIKIPYGKVAVDWKKENGKFSMKVSIPGNTTAKVFVPQFDGSDVVVYEVGSGDYYFDTDYEE
ncbi:Bacterial alpha-L-rhamnosidase [Candidatus Poribacteria bacterium]|nr:Bacterial alpha-L-rhamnosidase [Candidatus Poribacteria bacterium]